MTVDRKNKKNKKMNRGHLNIELLDGNTISMEVQKNVLLSDVLKHVCVQLNITESDYFGLAKLVAEEYVFLDHDRKLADIFKLPKRSFINEYDEKRVFTLHFRIQFFVINASVLRERSTRHHYYLQMRENFLTCQHEMSDEQIFTVVAYALQSDHDDIGVNFDPRLYFPASYIESKGTEYLTTNIPKITDILKGICTNETKMLYIRDLSTPPTNHNLHMYRLKVRKTDKTTRCIAICPDGIHIYEVINGMKSLKTSFTWSDIEKLTFEKKKFSIKTMTIGRKFTYYTESEFMSRYLLTQCQLTHRFYVGLQRRIKELSTMAEEDKKSRERFIMESSFVNSNERRSLSYRSIRSTTSQVKPACLTAPVPQIIGTPGEHGAAFMAYEPYISRHSSIEEGYHTPNSSSFISAGEYTTAASSTPSSYASPSSIASGGSEMYPLSSGGSTRVCLSRHLSDRVVSELTVSRGVAPFAPPHHPLVQAGYRNKHLQRHFSERIASPCRRYVEPLATPTDTRLNNRPRADTGEYEIRPLSNNKEIMINSAPVVVQNEDNSEELPRLSPERINKKSLPMIRCQNERRASVQIINQLMQCSSDQPKATIDVNEACVPDLKIPDFLIEKSHYDVNSSVIDTAVNTSTPTHCPLHGGSGHIVVESFKNHSLPMLSGLLSDVRLCACTKHPSFLPTVDIEEDENSLTAFEHLLTKNEATMAAILTQNAMRSNSVKRRAISDPKTPFIIAPLHSLTVE